MGADALEQFCRAIEAAFYGRDLAEFRDALAAEESAAAGALARATGIDDAALLARLAGLGIRPETLAALTLIPLVETAWADGVMDANERDAVLEGAERCGIAAGSASHRLLELWTAERPAVDLVGSWREFIAALCRSLEPHERGRLRAQVIGRARAVAAAAGDLREARPNGAAAEPSALDELAAAFGS